MLAVAAARPAEGDAELLPELVADPAGNDPAPRAQQGRGHPVGARGAFRRRRRGFCSACHETSAGNPFMLRELLVELAADASAGTAAEAAQVREVAPATIQRAVLVQAGAPCRFGLRAGACGRGPGRRCRAHRCRRARATGARHRCRGRRCARGRRRDRPRTSAALRSPAGARRRLCGAARCREDVRPPPGSSAVGGPRRRARALAVHLLATDPAEDPQSSRR